MTRDQIRKVHRLGKVRNANRILRDLSGYLTATRDGYESIYYLNKAGREFVGSEKIVKKTSRMEHTIMRNEFFIYLGLPTQWQNEVKLSDGDGTVIADAWFKKEKFWYALEVDNLQSMANNRKKIEIYKGLHRRKRIEKHTGSELRLVWLTTTEHRRKQLQEACAGIPCVVYLYNPQTKECYR
jgi:Replication-relaxation